jgi:hypothetical protein
MSETLEERLRRNAVDDPDSMVKVYPGDIVELLDMVKADNEILRKERDAAIITIIDFRKVVDAAKAWHRQWEYLGKDVNTLALIHAVDALELK